MSRTRQAKVATLDFVQDVARHVSGYKGYQEPTQRREDDRRFRTSIAEYLRGEAHRLERIESRQFREDFSDFLEEIDAGARKLEFLGEAVALPNSGTHAYSNGSVDSIGRVDREIVEGVERLHRVVHELEKAYKHDEQFEMNLAELRGISESIADLIEQRNVLLNG